MRLVHPAKEQGKKIVIVVGAGFGGLNAAKELADAPGVQVIVIDQRNHHLFQPLLYQVATAGLNPGDIAVPIRAQFSGDPNIEVHLGRIDRIDLASRAVISKPNADAPEEIELEFDHLILACGAQHSYFGHPEWEEFAPGLKSLEQATEIRKRILSTFELAENEIDPAKRAALLNFVVVGGGPTGVELAGAIADISRTVLVDDFRRIDPSSARVVLIEALPRILGAFSEELSDRATEDLRDLGVDVRLNTKVVNIDATGVTTDQGFIPSRCVIWGAGVAAAPVKFDREVDRDRTGRIRVNADLSLPGHPSVSVIGDLALIPWKENRTVPGLAPAAIQAGKYAAKKILSEMRGQKVEPFSYFDKGQMATIGRNRAILEAKGIKLSGFIAWMGWFFVHVLFLVGFKNRISVISQWFWNYVFSKRGSRLITERTWKLRQG
jgi:NADH dehydrogenase